MDGDLRARALSCVVRHAVNLEISILERGRDMPSGWIVKMLREPNEDYGIEIDSDDESLSERHDYGHVFTSEEDARLWSRKAAMEWSRTRGEFLSRPSEWEIASQGETGTTTFTAEKATLEPFEATPGVFEGCVALFDLQTLCALAVAVRSQSVVTDSPMIRYRREKECPVLYAVWHEDRIVGGPRGGLPRGARAARVIAHVCRNLRDANRHAHINRPGGLIDDEEVSESVNEFGGVLYTDRPFVVAEVKPVTAGQPADPVCNVFTTWGSFAQPPLVASPNARLPMAARRAVELQALAEIQARMAKYELTPNGIERLVRDLREKKEALSTIIFNCDDALIDAHEERQRGRAETLEESFQHLAIHTPVVRPDGRSWAT